MVAIRRLNALFSDNCLFKKKNNAEAFRKVFRQFVLMLKDMGLIEGETIGIDSFKIFAQNSLRNNYTQKEDRQTS